MRRFPLRDPDNDHRPEMLEARRRYIGRETPLVAGMPCPPEEAKGNVENMIGYVQVPVGIAAPLVLKGDFIGEYVVPLATTEGSMVASYQRGMRVLAEAGGVTAHVLRDGQSQWPSISFQTVTEALDAARFVEENRAILIEAAEATTRTGRVKEISWELLGRRLVIYLEMHTGDAHGINMITKASAAILAKIPGGGQRLVHGKVVEKRAAMHHWRGKWVVCEALIPGPLVKERLRTTAAEIAEMWMTQMLSNARLGTHNHALQIANGLAAIYIATGQDAAYVSESVAATLSIEDRAGDLYASLDLPSLHAAIVGGGTQKGTAIECQSIIGASSARELACVMAGALLAGDVNLAASMTRSGFVESHERLGRNRPRDSNAPPSAPLSYWPPSIPVSIPPLSVPISVPPPPPVASLDWALDGREVISSFEVKGNGQAIERDTPEPPPTLPARRFEKG